MKPADASTVKRTKDARKATGVAPPSGGRLGGGGGWVGGGVWSMGHVMGRNAGFAVLLGYARGCSPW